MEQQKEAEEIRENYELAVDGSGSTIRLTYLKNAKNGLPKYQIMLARSIARDIFDIYSRNPGKKYNIFIDVTRLGNLLSLASEARKIYAEAVANPQTDKIAALGKQTFYKVVISFISRVAGRELKWFTDEKAAKEWLS